MIALGVDKMLSVSRTRLSRAFIIISLITSITASAARTFNRNHVWQSREVLFRSGLMDTRNNAKVWYNYANYLRDQEDKSTAAYCYKESIRLWPDYVIALNNLATVTEDQEDIEKLLLKALHLDSGHVTSLFNLADLYRQQNLCAKSKFYFSQCLAFSECLSEANILINQCKSQDDFFDGTEERKEVLSRNIIDENQLIDPEQKVNFSKCHSRRS